VAVDAHGEVNLINPAAREILFSGPDKTLAHSPLLATCRPFCRAASRCTTANWDAMACC
jgi:hypothetical protein